MAKITISAHDHVEAFSANAVPAFARVYSDTTFTNDDDETVGAGSIDSANYVKQVSASYSAGVTTISSFATTNRIDSTTIGEDGGALARYTLALYTAKGKRCAIVYSGLVIHETPTTTTWSAIAAYNSAPVQPFRHQYYDTNQIDHRLDGLELAPDATDVLIGKARLSYLQATLADPIAVGDNDPIIRATRETVFLETYGHDQAGLNAAVTAIGATPTVLVITDAIAISSNTTLPSTLHLDPKANTLITVNPARTLTIGSMEPVGARQIFAGSGAVAFSKNATGGVFRIEWRAGISNAGDCTAAFTEAMAWLTANEGGVLEVGPGVWKHDGVVIPSGCSVRGAGRSTDITTGTVFKPFSTSAVTLFTISGGSDYQALQDCTVTTDGTVSTSSVCVKQITNAISAFQYSMLNVHLHATLAGCSLWTVTDAGSNLEIVGVCATNCFFSIPANGKGFHPNSINTTFLLISPTFSTGAGGTVFYLQACGWLKIIGLDARGPGSFVSTQTTDRTITGSMAAGTGVLTLTTGAYVQNDVGQPFTRGAATGYIEGLITSTTADTSYTGGAVADGSLTMERYVPSTSAAGKVFHIVGDHNIISCDGYADEGFQYFLVNDASTNVSPMTFSEMTIQSTIDLNAACVLAFNNCALRSQTFTDATLITASLFFKGCTWDKNTVNVITGGATPELPTPRVFGVHDGASKIYTDLSFHEGIEDQSIETQISFLDRRDGGTTPIAVFASASSTDQPAIRIGRMHPHTWDVDLYYDIYRDTTSGFLTFEGSQDLFFRGFIFNSNVDAVTFKGGVISPAQITANQNDYNPGDSSMLWRLNTDASRDITGVGLYKTQAGGEIHFGVNTLANNIVLKNQDTGSAAANRFLNVTGGDITVAQNELWVEIYDGTTNRWRTAKLNITGVTSNGTTVTVSLPASLSSTLGVTGAALFSSTVGIAGDATLSGGSDLIFIGTTGQSKILMTDNLADALTIGEAANPYITFVTTNSGEKINVSKSLLGISPTAGIGFAVGAGGAVAQGTSRTTGVTLDKPTGTITLFSAAGSATPASFTVTNNQVAANDVPRVVQKSGTDKYIILVTAVGAGSFEITFYTTGGTTTETPVFSFVIMKGAGS